MVVLNSLIKVYPAADEEEKELPAFTEQRGSKWMNKTQTVIHTLLLKIKIKRCIQLIAYLIRYFLPLFHSLLSTCSPLFPRRKSSR